METANLYNAPPLEPITDDSPQHLETEVNLTVFDDAAKIEKSSMCSKYETADSNQESIRFNPKQITKRFSTGSNMSYTTGSREPT